MTQLLGLFAVVIVISSLQNWLWHSWRVHTRREPWLPWTPRRNVPWGAADLILSLLVLIFLGALVMGGLVVLFPDLKSAAGNKLTANLQIWLISAESAAKVAAMLLAISLISLRLQVQPVDWGWQLSRLASDFKLGVIAFTMIVPVVYLVQGAIVYFGKWESKHPLIEMLKESPGGELYLVSFIAAVIIAPLVEEWTFRVLLQGWLEKIASGTASWEAIGLGQKEADVPEEMPLAAIVEPAEDAAPVTFAAENFSASPNPYLTPQAAAEERFMPLQPQGIRELRGFRAGWPIVVSATLFAGIHVAHGPDFVALFLLSLGQGYLYQRTHRIVPVILVHLLMNLFSMLAVAASLMGT